MTFATLESLIQDHGRLLFFSNFVPLVLLIRDRSFIDFIENCSTGRLFKFGRLFYIPNYDRQVNY